MRATEPRSDRSRADSLPWVRTSLDDGWSFNESIGLFLTRRCPLRCAHCIVSSDPKRPDPSPERVRTAARAIAAEARIRHVCVTGGEPFLRQALLKEVLTILRDANKDLSLITSGHWASTHDRARRVLEDVAGGVTDIFMWLSLDPYHSAFLPARHYAHALDAAATLNLRVGVTASYRADPQEAINFVRATLPPELLERVDVIRPQPLFLVGRAEGLGSDDELAEGLPRGRCGSCVPHVDENGALIACCSVFDADRDHPLHLGGVTESSLGSLLDRSDSDWLIQAIRTIGPRRLAELTADALPDSFWTRSYLPHDICSVCTGLLREPKAVKELRKRLEDDVALQQRIALARFVLYGETEMVQTRKEIGHAPERPAVPHREGSDR